MYDRAETAAANDALWSLIRRRFRARGLAAPDQLTRGEAAYAQTWAAPDLVLSQTCGLPFRAGLQARVTLIGTPDYGVPGCAPGHYRSVLVVGADDPRGSEAAFQTARAAINDPMSQSGWAALAGHFAGLSLTPPAVVVTGSHCASALAVTEGRADLAAIDAVTWVLLTRHEPWTAGLRVLAHTRPTPGLPLIAAAGVARAPVFDAVAEAIAALPPDDRHTLCLQGLIHIPASAYVAEPLPPAPAQFRGTD
jgi:ABC-type phosphate/phosphonate transport system substrate-binding protein